MSFSRRIRLRWQIVRLRWWLRNRVSGRIKLRGDVSRIEIDPSFRCDGDLWLGVHSAEGSIVIAQNVGASGPLVVTSVRPLLIGADTVIGPNVLVTDHYHGNLRTEEHRALAPSARPLHSPGPITIGPGVLLGANVVVLSPAEIGRGAIVGANVVVKGAVAEGTVYTGREVDRRRATGD